MTRRTQVPIAFLLSLTLAVVGWLAGEEWARRSLGDSRIALSLAPAGESVPGWIQDGYDYPYLLPTRRPVASRVESLAKTGGILAAWWVLTLSVSFGSARIRLGSISLRRLRSVLVRRAAWRACLLSAVVSSACLAVFWWAWLLVSLMLEDRRGAAIYGENPIQASAMVVSPRAVNDHPTSIAIMFAGWVAVSILTTRCMVLKCCVLDLSRLRVACPMCGYRLRRSAATVCPECGPAGVAVRGSLPRRVAAGMTKKRPYHDLVGPRVARALVWTCVFIMATSPVSMMLLMDWFGVLRVFRSGVYKLYGQADVAILRLLGLHP